MQISYFFFSFFYEAIPELRGFYTNPFTRYRRGGKLGLRVTRSGSMYPNAVEDDLERETRGEGRLGLRVTRTPETSLGRETRSGGMGLRVTRSGNKMGLRVTRGGKLGMRVTRGGNMGMRVTRGGKLGMRVTRGGKLGLRVTKKDVTDGIDASEVDKRGGNKVGLRITRGDPNLVDNSVGETSGGLGLRVTRGNPGPDMVDLFGRS